MPKINNVANINTKISYSSNDTFDEKLKLLMDSDIKINPKP